MHRAEISRVTVELGSAQRLVVRCVGPGAPTLVSEFDVYGEADSAVILRTGLDNTTAGAVRINGFFPCGAAWWRPARRGRTCGR